MQKTNQFVGTDKIRGYSLRSRVKRAFTLIEILVVIAILALLVSLSIPILGNIFGSAHQTAPKQISGDFTRMYQAWKAAGGQLSATPSTSTHVANILNMLMSPTSDTGPRTAVGICTDSTLSAKVGLKSWTVSNGTTALVVNITDGSNTYNIQFSPTSGVFTPGPTNNGVGAN